MPQTQEPQNHNLNIDFRSPQDTVEVWVHGRLGELEISERLAGSAIDVIAANEPHRERAAEALQQVPHYAYAQSAVPAPEAVPVAEVEVSPSGLDITNIRQQIEAAHQGQAPTNLGDI